MTTPDLIHLERDDTHRRYRWFRQLAGRLVRIDVHLPDGRPGTAALDVLSDVVTWTHLLDAHPGRRSEIPGYDHRRDADFAAAQAVADQLAATAATILDALTRSRQLEAA